MPGQRYQLLKLAAEARMQSGLLQVLAADAVVSKLL
jgi:hypothetical protein